MDSGENKKPFSVDDRKVTFLMQEFNQCFTQMRHYDSKRITLAQYAFSFYSAIVTATIALNKFFYYERNIYNIDFSLTLLLLLGSVIGFAIVVILVRNRIYFVMVAKQVNSIRNTLLNLSSLSQIKFDNFCPTNTNKPKLYNVESTHLKLIFLLSLINSVFLCFAGFFMLRFTDGPTWLYFLVLPILLLVSLYAELHYTRKKLDTKEVQ